jgi:hypothetical protein
LHQEVLPIGAASKIKALPQENSNKISDNTFELPYFDENTGGSHYINLRELHTVKLHILDFCVYREDGIAKLRLEDPCPEEVLPTWKLHYERTVCNFAEKAIESYEEVSNELKDKGVSQVTIDRALGHIIPKFSSSKLFEGAVDLSDRSISYNFKRIGRLRQPQSAAMLTKYASFHSRLAFEHDFGREYRQDNNP